MRLLFFQIYNWIKYKTFPTSFLFKNRLFLERDAKQKKIFANFGLTFRNSKWSQLDESNVKFQFRINFSKYIYFILIIFFFFLFKNFFIVSYFYNNVFFFFWSGIDTFDYYFSLILWALLTLLSLFLNLFYSTFFLSNKNVNKGIYLFNKSYENVNSKSRAQSKNRDKRNVVFNKWIILDWISFKGNSDTIFTNGSLDFIFNKKGLENKYNFKLLSKLYHTVFNLSKLNGDSLFCNKIFTNLKWSENYFLNTSLMLKYFNLFFVYYNQKNNVSFYYFSNNNMNFLKSNLFWQIKLSPKLYFFKLQNFNINSSINKYNVFHIIFSNLQNQLFNAKETRWLYKYSILHRKNNKNIHKFNYIKSHLNSNIFNFEISNKNIWYSEFIKTGSNISNIKTFLQSNSNVFNLKMECANLNSTINNNLTWEFNEKILNKIELSYFWFLKRNYLFNYLNSNFFSSSLIKTKLTYLNKDIAFVNNFLLQSNLFIQNFYNFYNFFDLFENYNLDTVTVKNQKMVNFKNFYVEFDNKILFSLDDLNMLQWISLQNSFFNKNQFNVLKFSFFLDDFSCVIFDSDFVFDYDTSFYFYCKNFNNYNKDLYSSFTWVQ